MLIPGLGQIYNGQGRKALMLWGAGLLANVLLMFVKIESTYLGLIALLVAELLFYLLVCVDAFVCARRLRTTTRLFKPSRWYAYVGFVALVYVAALPMAFVVRRYFFQTYKIPSGAMEPTLLIGDQIVVDKRPRQARRGDVIVFVFPPDRSKDFVKRVIAVGGDTVAVKNGIVYLNGQLMPDPYAHFEVLPQNRSPVSPRDNFGPATVPAGKLFVMGDNRDRSYDSRFWGFVNEESDLEGRVLYVYWSRDLNDHTVRVGRFGKLVQ
jgi:signal peptidase I